MLIGLQQAKRVTVALTRLQHLAQPPAEGLLQLTEKTLITPAIDLLTIFPCMAPNQRTTPTRHRQQRQRPVAGEAFERPPLRSLGRRNVSNGGKLRVITLLPLDIAGLRQRRT
ncbi:hypothetical protein D3C81_1790600 [compost metagenome]